jgi:23S rRNA-/tRNA-specific pseudouridylate synthase
MAWMGYPLVGDRTYGPASAGDGVVERTFLHARELTLVHPSTGDVMHFTAPLPNDLQNALAQLKPVDL